MDIGIALHELGVTEGTLTRDEKARLDADGFRRCPAS